MAERKLNWRQACVAIGCGKTKFYELVRTGRLRAYRTGDRGLWVTEEDVQSVIEAVEPDAGQKKSQSDKSFVR